MIEMRVGDEKELLLDGARRTPSDVEDASELGDDDAGLVAADGDALDGVPVQFDAFAVHCGACLAVLFFLFDCSADGGEVAGDSEGGHEAGAGGVYKVVNRWRAESIGEREDWW